MVQLSEIPDGAKPETAALHTPVAAFTVVLAGHVMLGSVASVTVTLNEQVAVRPPLSVAV
jgi:hypothetical protein